ncbi:leucyl aminopeptidase [Motilibacter peucedani]|uniref:Probable cytosol aminopeptidase n=1 Tax=Motilibacter peucedani TaxID=598650 RepID=A0A420XMH3_9ACTN|nr:leucyl aminopeptidase [Motilibacter peucedani]RKS72462.1 leucyl aminopeptidase [Motilibacter peucedani]
MARPRTPRALARADALPVVSVVAERSALVDSAVVALAVPVRQGAEAPAPGAGASEVADAFGLELADELAHQKATGAPGEVVEVPVSDEGRAAESLLLVGTGDGSPSDLRRAGAQLARRAGSKPALATTLVADEDPESVRAAVEGLLAGAYRVPRSGLTASGERLRDVRLLLAASGPRRAAAEAAVARAVATGRALALARDLINSPADVVGPVELAEEAQRVGAAAGLEVHVRDEAALAAEGFGGLLAVGSGSRRPPRLVEMRYEPETERRVPHVVLVGKGICFDSGGLSLKPRDAMVSMKTDMAGAGAVLGVMSAVRELGVRVRVTGLLAIAENLPDGAAYRPGDVVRHYDGTTVEVLNTDAEGRMVLADALGYADAQLAPDAVVDIATLTGAASLGLGKRHGALYATDERLAEALLAASERGGERLWRMPLVEDYRSALDSPVADLAHVPRDPHVGGGSITAALFLREFTGTRAWAHLDVAGPARADADDADVNKGGTGFGVRLLLRWLEGLGAPVRRG